MGATFAIKSTLTGTDEPTIDLYLFIKNRKLGGLNDERYEFV